MAQPKPQSTSIDDDYIPTNKICLKDIKEGDKPTVLVSCGSFSPITFLHLRLFEMVRDYARSHKLFKVIGGYLSPVNDEYKKPGLAPAKHRIEMCERAVASSDWIMVDAWEATRPQYTFTVDVLESIERRLKLQFPNVPISVKLVCGADLLASFNIPGVWAEDHIKTIVNHFGVICIERPGSNTSMIVESNPILKEGKDNIVFVEQKISNDVSSTKVRNALLEGSSIRYLTPDPVVDYIMEHKLFVS